jgi:hypothetical protein
MENCVLCFLFVEEMALLFQVFVLFSNCESRRAVWQIYSIEQATQKQSHRNKRRRKEKKTNSKAHKLGAECETVFFQLRVFASSQCIQLLLNQLQLLKE